jgi:hypothetical protein
MVIVTRIREENDHRVVQHISVALRTCSPLVERLLRVGQRLAKRSSFHATLAPLSSRTQRVARDMIQLTEDAGLIHRWSFGANRPVKFATVPQPLLVGAEARNSVSVCVRTPPYPRR